MATQVFLPLWFFSMITYFLSTKATIDNYIIHMDLLAMPKAFSSHHNWYKATLSLAMKNDHNTPLPSNKLIYSYKNVMNGFSASLTPQEHELIKASPGYISSILDAQVKLHTTHTPKFLGLNPSFGAWPNSQYGKDVIIGLVDTGVWPESESFKDNGGFTNVPSRWKGQCENSIHFNSSNCNKKLIGAKFFNKGLIAKNPKIKKISINSTRDIEGHGTHTASTAAGSRVYNASYFGYATGTATGTAPMARLAMYKALWEEGAVSSDIIAAIDSAIEDGVDVLSLSFGFDRTPLYTDPVAIATFAAVEKGIFVTTSSGNDGPFLGTLHNGTPWVITVAASTVDREFHGTLTLGNAVEITGLSLYPGPNVISHTSIVYDMAFCNDTNELHKVKDKIVVCEENGLVSLDDQFFNVENSKVFGAVFITNSSDILFFLQSSFPTLFVNPMNGKIIKDYIKVGGNGSKASMSFKETIYGTKPNPSVDSYSSRGPSYSCPHVLKPDIAAPGTLILAAWPYATPVGQLGSKNLLSNFNLLTGTSMACPHVAGIAALLKGAYPQWDHSAIRSAMMTTSDILDNTMKHIKDLGNGKKATPLALGAGHINPNKALDPGLVYNLEVQDYVNLLCAMKMTQKEITAITRRSSYNCPKNPKLDLNYPSFIAYYNGKKPSSNNESKTLVHEFHRTVTNVGEGHAIYVASVTPIKGFHVSVVPEKLVFKMKNEKQSYKLRIEGPKLMKKQIDFGYLSWTDLKHVVRSPIVVTSLPST
ncbi:hypothetical protein HN51_021178 [Arachis hypogaea]|uniref:Subtilisin-like protease n=1 Tax=Arachis hypogaea TaxID=3818 RepID=A0A445EHM8_ARAHY|nr:subtilisin-like protease SBT1.9 [Arachis hypogaea]QHO52184.1 uncharacterized protein DS421_2g37360 [Arachis hypogaea]RYR74949.1 hypothetical protein Ahy_A02g009668 [Arachis hypogaea]